ncbi:MAG: hypothetical protein AAGM04_04375 [Pseudomonadota bacterium]
MFSFLFRILGLSILALAVVLAVLDVTRSITASAFVLTPLAVTWSELSPASLNSARLFVLSLGLPWLWDPLALALMRLPSWLLFWFFAMVLMWMGRKKDNRYGRFANR